MAEPVFIGIYRPDLVVPTEIRRIPNLNAGIGNQVVPGVMQKFNKEMINDIGEMLMELCTQNELNW